MANTGSAQTGEYVAGLEKGLAVIEAFGARHPRLTISEAARLAELSRASARRCLLTLQKLGYAEYDGRYFRLTPRALRLGYAYVMSTPLPRVVQPVLETLSERTHESASVAILDAAEIVFIARSTTRRSLSAGIAVGTRLSAYGTATGRVLLSNLTDAALRALIRETAPTKLTPKTVTDTPSLLSEIRNARTQGYAISDEELELGLRSIAVPIRNAVGDMVAAMSLSVQTARMGRAEMVEQLLPALETARRMISAML
ncbi:MAG: IclR family transcriptional regulator [Betaproteobacteria bacterium RIFCSPLOWO2_02_FULL_63_19]|nr:MAG: IclR family transcriptional regulator [Betaproteobacteria bacterium RIFCSPLOWO2_02_FULL_63_19]